MNALLSFETSVTLHATTWCNIPEDFNLEPYRRKNFKCRIYLRVPAFFKQTIFRNDSRPTNTRLRRAVLWLRWLVTSLTVEVRLRSQDSSCGVCDGQSATGASFSESTSVSPVIIIPHPSCHLRYVMSAVYSSVKITYVFYNEGAMCFLRVI